MTEPADTPVAGLGDPTWLRWAKALRSVAQAGLTYSESPFDRDRYSQVQAIAAEMVALQAGVDRDEAHRCFAEAVGYETPKVDVRVSSSVMDASCWCASCLMAAAGRCPAAGLMSTIVPARPSSVVWEESGYRVRATKVLAVYDRRLHGAYAAASLGHLQTVLRVRPGRGRAGSIRRDGGCHFLR